MKLEKKLEIIDQASLGRMVTFMLELAETDYVEVDEMANRLEQYVKENDPEFMVFSEIATKEFLKFLRRLAKAM